MNAPVVTSRLSPAAPFAGQDPLAAPSLAALMEAATLPGPTFVFSPRSAAAVLSDFQRGFPGETTFAVKACPVPRLIEAFAAGGMTAFDVASLQEMQLVRSVAPQARLHYNNPIRSDAETLAALLTYGVRHFAVDDFAGLDKLVGNAARAGIDRSSIEVAIRLKPRRNAARQDFRSKFGATRQEAESLIRAAQACRFRIGVTGHPGSQCLDPASYADFIQEAGDIARQLDVTLVTLNVGGGFPVAYPGADFGSIETYFDVIRDSFDRAFRGSGTRLVAEPGRALAARCLSLLAPVKHVRPTGDVFLEDGIYGALMELLIMPMALPIRVWRDGAVVAGPTRPARLYGPTCDPIDVLPGDYAVPADLVEGDIVEFGLIGGYGPSTVTRFNGYGAIAVVEADGILGSAV